VVEEEGRLRAALLFPRTSEAHRPDDHAVHTSVAMRCPSLVAVLLVALVATPGGGAQSKPTVTVTRVLPVTIKGSGFVAGERVKILVRVPVVYRKTVTAGRRGRFTAIFRIPSGKCIKIRVVATGNKGSRASTTVPASCRIVG
jgi:hypothetical protein